VFGFPDVYRNSSVTFLIPVFEMGKGRNGGCFNLSDLLQIIQKLIHHLLGDGPRSDQPDGGIRFVHFRPVIKQIILAKRLNHGIGENRKDLVGG